MLYFFAGMGGNAFGSGLNPVAMQAALSGGGGMPFFGGAFGGSRAGKYYYCDYVMYCTTGYSNSGNCTHRQLCTQLLYM